MFLVFCPLPVFMSTHTHTHTLDFYLDSSFRIISCRSLLSLLPLLSNRGRDSMALPLKLFSNSHILFVVQFDLIGKRFFGLSLSFFLSQTHTNAKPNPHHGNTRHSFWSTDELSVKLMNPRWLPVFYSLRNQTTHSSTST